MTVELASAYVQLIPTAKGIQGGIEKELNIDSAAGAAGKSAGSSLSKSLLTAATAAGIGVAIGSFLKGAFSEASEAQKVGAQTAAVLKSTGDAANISSDQIGDLANTLSKKAGIDDEVIQSGENMLLTFKNIRNEAGKGNDIFNRTTTAALDMAAGMAAASGGQVDLKSASIQLGKALNDPVKGITALTRVGVTFTEQQKDQIKALVASGDTLGAQKIILKEVNSEFAGSAAANATDADKAAVAIANFKEAIGTALLPVLNTGAQALTALADGFSSLPAPLQAVATYGALAAGGLIGIAKVAGALGGAKETLTGLGTSLSNSSGAASKLGQAGLVAAAGFGAFELTTWGLHAAQDAIFGTTESYEDKLKDLDKATKAVDGSTKGMVLRFEDVIKAYAEANPNAEGATITLGAFKEVAEKNLGVAARLAEQFPKTSATYRGMQLVLTKLTAEHNAAAVGADGEAAALQRVTGQVDYTTDSFKKAADSLGFFGAAALSQVGVTGDALDAISKSAQSFSQSLEGSIDGATDPFSKFSGQLDVSQEDFENFFVGSQMNAAQWADEITDLIGRGVDEGLLQQIAKAGPNSKPLLDDFVREVDTHGVEWVNSVSHAGDDAAKITEEAFRNMVSSAAIHGAEEALIVQATTADMKDGGTKNLAALASNTDTNLAVMAYLALQHLAAVRDGVNGLPTEHPISVPIVVTITGEQLAVDTFRGQVLAAGGNPAAAYATPPPTAVGGVFSSPQVRLFGEAGPEAVLPLNDPRRSWEIIQQAGLMATSSAAPSSAPLAGATINYNGPLDDPVARTRGIYRDLRNASVLAGIG